jgi:hypothetical protein
MNQFDVDVVVRTARLMLLNDPNARERIEIFGRGLP